jgi:threonine/homoserine/homoserine lactone efflux protein
MIGAYLIFLAVKLWRWTATANGVAFSASRVLLTTLLNPKAAIFALLIFPARPTPIARYYIGFALIASCLGAAWIVAGSLLARFANPRISSLAPRLCAVAVAAFAVAVVSSALMR